MPSYAQSAHASSKSDKPESHQTTAASSSTSTSTKPNASQMAASSAAACSSSVSASALAKCMSTALAEVKSICVPTSSWSYSAKSVLASSTPSAVENATTLGAQTGEGAVANTWSFPALAVAILLGTLSVMAMAL